MWGSDLPPDNALIVLFPSLAFDTFVTIGTKRDDDGTLLSPDWPGFAPGELGGMQDVNNNNVADGIEAAWFVLPNDPQGEPDVNNQVLLGQFSVDLNDGANGNVQGIEGQFLVQGESNGVFFRLFEEFKQPIPAPGTLPLLGVVGLIGRRRRR